MSFLTKLLAPKQTAPKEEALGYGVPEGMVSAAFYEDALTDNRKQREDFESQLQQERNTIGNLVQRNRELQTQLLSARAEADANKADAEAHRRSKANLKQFRKADAKPMDAGTF